MSFKVGDRVIHPAFGMGHIRSIEKKEFSDEEKHLYYKVALLKRTVWIPVEAEGDGGLRFVTAKSDLDRYRALLKSPPAPLEIKHHQRHLELISRLKEGTFLALCEVVRDLTAWGWRKPLGPTDTSTLQRIKESLYREWATADGVSPTEASREIDALLEKNQQVNFGSA